MEYELRVEVKSAVEHLTGERAMLFVRCVENGLEVFLYAKPVEVKMSDGQTLKVGYFGKVLKDYLTMMRA